MGLEAVEELTDLRYTLAERGGCTPHLYLLQGFHQAGGDHDQARHHWQEALTSYTDLDVRAADDIRAHLAALDQAATDPQG